ncbi:MAG: exodeoxyribonuclease [Verrucomicrobiaceae bacterium]|nr:exodeoxyribonuclease [Verrucomicrobiaceae bacterium]
MQTFYWHDYETWGTNPAQDRPSQFAGIRTDLDFNIIGEPLVQYCQPPQDLLPQPEACLITGITPQLAQEKGIPEHQFIASIHRELAAPDTCGVGYNSIRFDDEVTRFALYRNFYDAYEREWKNGNSRWDIIDMVRACRALRPDGIEWPNHDDGKPSFKLEHLTAANNLKHEAAHDALSDVYATIAVAKLIKQRQPKLFDYLFKLRNKREVAALLNLAQKKPVLHISGMFPTERGCAALVLPLAQHPGNNNEIICYDLSVDPAPLLELSAEEIRLRVFTSSAELIGERIPLKTIRLNRCPVVATDKLLDEKIAQRLLIDRSVCERNMQRLLSNTTLSAKLRDVFVAPERIALTDPEQMLYSGGFFSNADRATMTQVRKASGKQLATQNFVFEDKRLPEILFRYRARNFPATLNEDERAQWQEFCLSRLTDASAGASVVLDNFRAQIAALSAAAPDDTRRTIILQNLAAYADTAIASATA